jgi:hypothetical protein
MPAIAQRLRAAGLLKKGRENVAHDTIQLATSRLQNEIKTSRQRERLKQGWRSAARLDSYCLALPAAVRRPPRQRLDATSRTRREAARTSKDAALSSRLLPSRSLHARWDRRAARMR